MLNSRTRKSRAFFQFLETFQSRQPERGLNPGDYVQGLNFILKTEMGNWFKARKTDPPQTG